MGTTYISRRGRVVPRERHRHLDIPARETKLIPALQHPALILQPVILHILHQYAQLAPLRRDLLGVVPLQVVGRAVPEVDGLPVGVVPGKKVRFSISNLSERTRSFSWQSKPVRVFAQAGVATSISSGIWNLFGGAVSDGERGG